MSKNTSTNKHKSKEINTNNKLKVLELQKDNGNNPYKITIPRNKKFSPKDILRLHSNLIRSFINGSIESNEAKTLSYLCASYLQALESVEIEKRLSELEEKLPDK